MFGMSYANTYLLRAHNTKFVFTQLEYVIGPTGMTGPNGSNYWNALPNYDLFYLSGRVGLGKNFPNYTLDISGDIKVSNIQYTNKRVSIINSAITSVSGDSIALDFTKGSTFYLDSSVTSEFVSDYTVYINSINVNIVPYTQFSLTLISDVNDNPEIYYGNSIAINGSIYPLEFLGGESAALASMDPSTRTLIQVFDIIFTADMWRVLTKINCYF